MYTVVYTIFPLLKNKKAIHPLNELGGLLAIKRIKKTPMGRQQNIPYFQEGKYLELQLQSELPKELMTTHQLNQ